MKKPIALLLCLASLVSAFAGCGAKSSEEAYVPTGDALLQADEELPTEAAVMEEETLVLAYYPNRSMNPLIAMPLLLAILIISGHFAVENCIAVVTEVNEAIASLSTEITIHIEILENVLLIEASAGSHQQSVITSLIGTSYIAHIFCIENSVSYYCCILYVLATESCYGH